MQVGNITFTAEFVTLIALAAVGVANLVLGIVVLVKLGRPQNELMERRLRDEIRFSRQETEVAVARAIKEGAALQAEMQARLDERQDTRLRELREQLNASQETLQRTVNGHLHTLDERFERFSAQSGQGMDLMRRTVEQRMEAMQAGNEKRLEQMRLTVDEKLQKTLDERLKQSFSLVNESLDKVQRGLGEMHTLANGVGDLKRVLSNVKTRGMLGEIQLSAILEEILAPEQYAANVETVPGSGERVEFAVKLPGAEEGDRVWLPIDAKFPVDAYTSLLDSYDLGDAAKVEVAAKALETRIRAFGKDIHQKYVGVPYTTEFAIMFFPVEGLYAEAVRLGLVERLQTDYKINIAGPTTLAALLNSLQMGFRTLAIQKRSGEVWKVLGEVKTEFGKFGEVLSKTKRHLELASRDIDELVGTRSNQIQRKLNGVTSFADDAAPDKDPEEFEYLEKKEYNN